MTLTLKTMVTTAAVAMAVGVLSGCSAVPPAFQSQNAYGSVGRALPGRPGLAASSTTVTAPNGRVVGADPDVNVRYDLNRNAAIHLGGGGS